MMPHSVLAEHVAQDGVAKPDDIDWRHSLIVLAMAWAGLFLGFAHDWLTILRIAWNISAFNHILLIPVILGVLVYQRAPELAKIAPQAWWPGLLLTVGGATAWMLGAFSGLDFARQLGVVLMLISTVPALLGMRVSAGLIFPLCYALLLVPFGQELVPTLQLITAKITVYLVQVFNIPAVVEGVFIDTPAGLFQVAEACSGVQFLIAMLALGFLVANVCFKSRKRRIIFLIACVIVPVLANGVRAFATIYMAQWIGAERAVGFDHIVYGWVFFSVIVAMILAGAWRYFDRPPGDPMIDANAINASPFLNRLDRWTMAAVPALMVMILVAGGAQAWAKAADTLAADMPSQIALPAVAGWQLVHHVPRLAWEPQAQGADQRLLGSYTDPQGRRIDVFFALYASQGDGREAGGFGQGALIPNNHWAWLSPGPVLDGGKSELLRGDNGDVRLAVTWYQSGPLITGSNTRLKIRNMTDRLLLRETPTAMLILSSVEGTPARSHETIVAFLRDAGPLQEWMHRIAGMR